MKIISGCFINGDQVWFVNGQYHTATAGQFVLITDQSELRRIEDLTIKQNIAGTTFAR